MEKLLYIEASPRKKRSASIQIAQEFLKQYKESHPDTEVVIFDLWKEKLPEFDGATIDAKYAIMHGQKFSEEQAKAWKGVEGLIEHFKSADKYLFSLPMWNFGIPYKLKHYIDLLVQPGYTFAATSEGYKGLVTNKKALLVYARGSEYGPKTGIQNLDLQKSYMETILGFIGFQNLQSLIIEPTLGGDEKKAHALQAAQQQIQQVLSKF